MRDPISQSKIVVRSNQPWRTAPCSGYKYLICERRHGRAITQAEDRNLFLETTSKPYDEGSLWLCVSDNGGLAFQNLRTGLYLTHNGWDKVVAETRKINGWERFTIQPHPGGGYLLLSSYWSTSKVVIHEEGKLYRRSLEADHAWDFVAVGL